MFAAYPSPVTGVGVGGFGVGIDAGGAVVGLVVAAGGAVDGFGVAVGRAVVGCGSVVAFALGCCVGIFVATATVGSCVGADVATVVGAIDLAGALVGGGVVSSEGVGVNVGVSAAG